MALCHDLGRFFFVQGRPGFYREGCVTYCVAVYKYRYSNVQFVEEFVRKNSWFQSSTGRTVHAEERVLRRIAMTENYENCIAASVELYSSFSPCKECCTLIEEFMQQRPYCQVHMAFTCPYRIYEETHASALRKLNGLRNIRLLDVFTEREWRLLLDKGLIYLSPDGLMSMEVWDNYWREELKKVLCLSL